MKLALLPRLDFLHHTCMYVTSGSGAYVQDHMIRPITCVGDEKSPCDCICKRGTAVAG